LLFPDRESRNLNILVLISFSLAHTRAHEAFRRILRTLFGERAHYVVERGFDLEAHPRQGSDLPVRCRGPQPLVRLIGGVVGLRFNSRRSAGRRSGDGLFRIRCAADTGLGAVAINTGD